MLSFFAASPIIFQLPASSGALGKFTLLLKVKYILRNCILKEAVQYLHFSLTMLYPFPMFSQHSIKNDLHTLVFLHLHIICSHSILHAKSTNSDILILEFICLTAGCNVPNIHHILFSFSANNMAMTAYKIKYTFMSWWTYLECHHKHFLYTYSNTSGNLGDISLPSVISCSVLNHLLNLQFIITQALLLSYTAIITFRNQLSYMCNSAHSLNLIILSYASLNQQTTNKFLFFTFVTANNWN